jgi:hypothetical protein
MMKIEEFMKRKRKKDVIWVYWVQGICRCSYFIVVFYCLSLITLILFIVREAILNCAVTYLWKHVHCQPRREG